MVGNCTLHGSLAATTAVVCVLCLAPAAMASGSGFCGLLLEELRCCPPGGEAEGIAAGVACPPVGAAAVGRVAALAGGTGRLNQATSRVTLAQSEGNQRDTAPADDAPATEPPADSEAPSDAEAGESFEGSARPAGPDLTLTEERALISGGWD